MQALMVSSLLLSTIVGTVVGLKLLLMAKRTRQFPEFAVGSALFCYAALAQTSLFATSAVGSDGPFALRMTLLAVRIVSFYLTLVGLSAFTWRVFDASSTWRKSLVLFLALTGIGAVAASYWAAWHQASGDSVLPLYGRFGVTPQFAVAFAWMALESLRYQRQMRRRQAIGLADPAVTNRFGVWGASAAGSSLLVIALITMQFRSETAVVGSDPMSSVIITATGLVNVFGWWLTFMPPAAYTRWIRTRVGISGTMDVRNG